MDITGYFPAQVESADLQPLDEVAGGAGGELQGAASIALSSILSAVENDQTLSSTKRSDVRSALKALARHQLCGLGDIPATAKTVEAIIAAMRSDPRGLKKERISNIASQVRGAVALYAAPVCQPKRAHISHLSPAWQALILMLPNTFDHMGLARLGRWATGRGLEPVDIRQVHVDRFEVVGLESVKHPSLLIRRMVGTWNKAADDILGWPTTRLAATAKPRRTYRVALEDMAPTLRDELETYFGERTRNNGRILLPSDDNQLPGLRASSAEKGLRLVAQYLGALKAAGEDVSRIQSLQDLASRERVRSALSHLLDRQGGKAASQLSNMAGTLVAIARHALGDAELATDLSILRGKVVPQYRGMVDRNRTRLMVLGDPVIRRRLLRLPFDLMEKAHRGCGKRAALDAQIAVAIDLLIITALRIGNIASLNLDKNIRLLAGGKTRDVAIVLDPTEVKNSEERQIVLGHDTTSIFNTYLDRFRPELSHRDNRFLFPGNGHGPKGSGALSQQISKAIKDNVGIAWHPHLFRALAVLLHLDTHPGDHMGAMSILGDRSLRTFTQHYLFIETAKAHKAFQETVAATRGRARPSLRATIRHGAETR